MTLMVILLYVLKLLSKDCLWKNIQPNCLCSRLLMDMKKVGPYFISVSLSSLATSHIMTSKYLTLLTSHGFRHGTWSEVNVKNGSGLWKHFFCYVIICSDWFGPTPRPMRRAATAFERLLSARDIIWFGK